MTQDQLDKEWLHTRIHLGPLAAAEGCLKNLPDKEYIITGCQIKENGSLHVGLMPVDYSPKSQREAWLSLLLCVDCVAKLPEFFHRIGSYEPILHEALVLWGEEIEGEDGQRHNSWEVLREKPDDVDIPVHPYPMSVGNGDLFYQATWRGTDGRIRSHAWGMEPTQFNGTSKERRHEMMDPLRGWIKAGLYHREESAP